MRYGIRKWLKLQRKVISESSSRERNVNWTINVGPSKTSCPVAPKNGTLLLGGASIF